MILPLSDDNTGRRTFPYVTVTLIALNALVYVVFQGAGTNDRFTMTFSTVPYEIVTGEDKVTEGRDVMVRHEKGVEKVRVPGLEETPLSVYLTLLTSMFMHGGWMHLLGNMLFLWIFGDNVEDSLGHVRYLIFYFLCGILASLSHVYLTVWLYGVDSPQALVPALGASGAISGVLGGYIVFHPHRRVLVLMLRVLTEVPAYVAIGIWFVFQLITALASLGPESGLGGVAFAAHIGGFLAGIILVWPFAINRV
jgi:membrane associated rhomboid family serine protease